MEAGETEKSNKEYYKVQVENKEKQRCKQKVYESEKAQQKKCKTKKIGLRNRLNKHTQFITINQL